MSCTECQGQIFEGELDRDAVVHLTECEDCRALDREVRLNATALASMKDDVMPVRSVQRRPRYLSHVWPWIAAAAAGLLILAGLHYLRTESTELVSAPQVASLPVENAPQPAVDPPLPEPQQFAAAEPAAKSAPSPRRPRPQPALAEPRPVEPEPTLLVKLVTDDPDVVIYWLIEPKGEQAI